MNTKIFGMLVVRYRFYSRDLVRVWMELGNLRSLPGMFDSTNFLNLVRIGFPQYVLQRISNLFLHCKNKSLALKCSTSHNTYSHNTGYSFLFVFPET